MYISLCFVLESRCFDCNYRPSGYSKGSYGQVGHNAGAAQCGLVRYGDADALDKWACTSGQCFIRLDKNGRKNSKHLFQPIDASKLLLKLSSGASILSATILKLRMILQHI